MDENFRYKTNSYSLHFIIRQIESGRMDVNPEFKDLKIQSLKEKSLFIESLIIGIPTQPIWCEESPSGDYIVIEGSERLLTLVEFSKGKFNLRNLKIRKEYINLYFEDLPYHEKISLEDRYLLNFIIINYDTSPQLKCEFFRRILNDTGNSNDQSARNFAWPQSFKFIQHLQRNCEDLVIFEPKEYHSLRYAKINKFRSEISQVFLYLLMISLILDGNLFESAYLDDTIVVDDLLDWTMNHFEKNIIHQDYEVEKINRCLTNISNYLGEVPRILLASSIRLSKGSDNDLILPELYFLFIKSRVNKLDKPINWNAIRSARFFRATSAKNLISYIFQARND